MSSAALVVIALARPAGAGEAAKDGPPPWIEALSVAFGSRAEAKGDRDGALEEMRSCLGRHIDSPAADVLLLRMKEIVPYDRDPRRAAAAYEHLLRTTEGLPGRTRELLTDRIARNYRAAGLFGRAEAAEREMGYLRSWAVIGPFGHTRWSAHDKGFPPEREIDFERPVRPVSTGGRRRELRWTMYEAPGSGRRVDLFGPLWPEEGAGFALAQVRSGRERDAFLLTDCAGSFKVWFNGRLIADVDEGRRHSPDKGAFQVRLGEGWNRLVVKVSARAPVVSFRFADERGAPLGGLGHESRLVLREHVPSAEPSLEREPPPGYAPPGYALPGSALKGGLLVDLSAREVKSGELALLHAAEGLARRYLGDSEGELDHMQKAAELAAAHGGERPHLWYELARTAERSPLLPKSIRRSRSQKAYRKAARAGFVPAVLEIVERLRRDKKAELAIERLKRAAAQNPDGPRLVLFMAKIALDEGWTHEARTWAHDAEKIDPSSRGVQLFWARFHSLGRNVPRMIAAYAEALSVDQWDYSSREVFAGLLLARGKTSAGLRELKKALEADPARLAGYRALARAQMDAGRYENAISTLRAGLRLSPEYPWLRRQLGEVYFRWGKEGKALAEWKRALEIYPGWHELRRQVEAASERGRGVEHDFATPFSTDVKKAIAESKSVQDYPNADVILVVDLTVDRIYADGSYSEITHQAQKALTTEGVEKLSSIRVEGELLEAGTHRPDGTILEPAVLPGRDSLTMPGVEIGAVVEYKYRRDHPAPPGEFFKLPSWYFRSLETPHQWSHYVVIAPEGMKLTVVKRRWGKVFPEEKFEEFPEKVEGGLRTYRWLATNTRPLNPSAGHDHMSTLLPHIEVGRARTWQDLTADVLDLFLGRTRLTKAIREETRRATASLGEARRSREETARAIFHHVCELVQADADVYDAHQILLARAGSRSVLLAAMLSAAGLDARFALTRPRPEAIGPSQGPGEPEWAFPSRRMFHDTLVAVPCERGETLWFDAEGPYSAFGAIPPRFQGGLAFCLPPTTAPAGLQLLRPLPAGLAPEDGTFATLPWGLLREHGEVTRTRLDFDPASGGVRGEKEFLRFGSLGAVYKELFAESSSTWRETWVEKRLSKALQGSRLERIEIDGLDEPDSPFTVRAHFELAEAMGPSEREAGSWREIPTGIEPLDTVSAYVKVPKRTYPMKISSPLVRRDKVVTRLPGAVAWAPPPPHTEKTAFGSYSLAYTWTGETLAVVRDVTLLPQIVEPEDYEEFVRFCREIDAAEHAPLVVRMRPD